MAGEWQTVKFSDVCDIWRGGSPRPIHEWIAPQGIPWVKISDATAAGSRYIEQTKEFILPEGRTRSREVVPGDLILSNSATPGIPMFMGIDACIHDGWLLLRNFRGIDKLFCYYLLLHERPSIVRQGTGSVFTNLKTEILKNHVVSIPPIKEQQAIAHILGALDDKIELNRRTNETLEGIARAVFESWFVDFDPVRAKAAGQQPPGLAPHIADLFPDAFEESELGEIPRGWRSRAISDFCTITVGGDWGSDQPFETAIEAVCLRGVDLEHLRQSGWADAPRRWLRSSSVASRCLDERDILVAASGVGPLGRPLWMAQQLEEGFDLPVVYSNFCKRLRCKSVAVAVYIDRWLHMMRESGEIWEYATGTSIPNLDTKALLSKVIVFPPELILEHFFAFVQPVVARLYSQESRALAALRDTLLPKLISGELRVPDAEWTMGRYK